MTELERPVKRRTSAVRFEKSKHRKVVIILEPPATIGVKLEGSRNRTFRLDAEVLYEMAVKHYSLRLDRAARKIAKDRKIRLSAARRIATREMKGELK